jgi:hypothetical protein
MILYNTMYIFSPLQVKNKAHGGAKKCAFILGLVSMAANSTDPVAFQRDKLPLTQGPCLPAESKHCKNWFVVTKHSPRSRVYLYCQDRKLERQSVITPYI